MMKFSLQSKSSTKSKTIKPSQNFDDGDDNNNKSQVSKQYVTEFDASETLAEKKKPNIVIPPIANEWRPHKKMKNLELPITSQSDGSGGLAFEVESQPPLDAQDSNISYGLNLRQSSKSSEIRVPPEEMLLQKLKMDLERLPEHRGMEEFKEVPVEGFGAALLAGYGWFEGRGIGKNATEDVKIVQYEKRTDKQGLGFVSAVPSKEEEKGSKKKSKDRDYDSYDHNKNRKQRSREIKEKNTPKIPWLKSHIRVRIISKELKGGRLYSKKGEVVDVVGPTVCDIAMDESRELIQGVSQDLLETAIPHRGGPVLVLYGKHKGVYGNLVEKDTHKQTAVVRDADTHDLLNLPLDQIAEYIGDPTVLGY